MNKCFLVAGLAWGDESKGGCTDYLTRKHNASLVIRYNGGHQAAHGVVLPDGKQHVFSQFGSGTFVPGVETYLSRYMMVNPVAMLREEEALQKVGVTDAFKRLTIDGSCLVVTPFDRVLNLLRESQNKHGSCGVGIGETRLYNNTYGADSLFVEDLKHNATCEVKLMLRQQRAYEAARVVGGSSEILVGNDIIRDIMAGYHAFLDKHPNIVNAIAIHQHDTVIFEGAQGVLLDQRKEFAPHHTWSDCTLANADKFLDDHGFDGERIRVGCIRSYMTRHGAGPFNDDTNLDFLPELHNTDACFQGKFRRGHFDKAAIIKALDVCGGVDEIHMSHVDYLDKIHPGMTDADIEVMIRNLERFLETPITVTGHGPTHLERRYRGKTFTARRRSADIRNGVSLCSKE